ncbi:13830_t:CDS:2, partial [Acaulospora morrowiae]
IIVKKFEQIALDIMGIVTTVTGWATFGVAVRVLSNSIQGRPYFAKPATHALTAVFFTGVGTYLYFANERLEELIEKRKKILLANRKHRKELEALRIGRDHMFIHLEVKWFTRYIL